MINIFIDTNILFSKNEKLDEVGFLQKLQEIIDDIEVNDIYTEVKILLPRMVINELFQQQLDIYEDWKKQLEKVKMPNLKFDKDFMYEEYLTEAFKTTLKRLKKGMVIVDVVDFPKSDKLDNIISRALKKEPPFEGKDKHSDKGFKDVIIWETIKEFKEKHINDIIIFYCNDNLLASNELKKEFYNEFRDDIYIEQKDKLMDRLSLLCKKSEIIKTFSSQLKERIQKCMTQNNIRFYDMLMQDNIWNDGDEITQFEIINVDIISCNDVKVCNKISYNVEIEIKMLYLENKDRENYKLFGVRQFDVYYDFKENVLLTKSYDGLTMARSEWSDFVRLED